MVDLPGLQGGLGICKTHGYLFGGYLFISVKLLPATLPCKTITILYLLLTTAFLRLLLCCFVLSEFLGHPGDG